MRQRKCRPEKGEDGVRALFARAVAADADRWSERRGSGRDRHDGGLSDVTAWKARIPGEHRSMRGDGGFGLAWLDHGADLGIAPHRLRTGEAGNGETADKREDREQETHHAGSDIGGTRASVQWHRHHDKPIELRWNHGSTPVPLLVIGGQAA